MVGRFWYVDEKSLLKHKEETFKANQTSFGSYGFSAKELTMANSANVRGSTRQISANFVSSALKQTLFVFMAVIAIVAGGVAVVSVGKPFMSAEFSADLSKALASNSASAYSAMTVAENVLHSAFEQAYSDVLSMIMQSSASTSSAMNVPVSSLRSTDGYDQNGDYYSAAHAGLVVVPASTSSTDAKLAQTITNSFSDNVTVTPGPNGTTGVITPEFRTVKGHDFLYVLVPVKTGSSTSSDGSK